MCKNIEEETCLTLSQARAIQVPSHSNSNKPFSVWGHIFISSIDFSVYEIKFPLFHLQYPSCVCVSIKDQSTK